jgi:hypothetical protein
MSLSKTFGFVLISSLAAVAQAGTPVQQSSPIQAVQRSDRDRSELRGPVKSVLRTTNRQTTFLIHSGTAHAGTCVGPPAVVVNQLNVPDVDRIQKGPAIERLKCLALPEAPAVRANVAPKLLSVPNSGPTWQVYDLAGMLIEKGAVSNEGTPWHLTKIQRDANEREISRVMNADGKSPEVRVSAQVPVHDPDAQVKDTFSDASGKLIVHDESTLYRGEARFYNDKGEPDGGRVEKTEAGALIRTIFGADGKTIRKVVERRDDKGIYAELSEYDGDGKLVHSIHMTDGKLTYGYQDPSLKTPFMFGSPGRGTSYVWVAFPGGGGETWVSNHPNSSWADPDSIERVDQNGVVQERLSLEYVRDAYGNWTTMKATDWKRDMNKTTLLGTDTRVIEYYR